MAEIVGQTLLDRYRVGELVGRGGMAEVYRAWDLRRNHSVALKMIRTDLAEDREFVRRFRREAQSLERLEHRNIVRSYGLERSAGRLFIVMDFVEGLSLRQRLYEAEGPLAVGEAMFVIRQVAAALAFAHDEGIVHRDMKPGNILLSTDGRVLLSDFGVAKLMDLGTETEIVPGTPAYMSPEQCAQRAATGRSDLYSLAVVVYEMFAGRRPFVGDSPEAPEASMRERLCYEHQHVLPLPIRRFNSGLPGGVDDVLSRALAKNPIERFGSAIEMLRAIEGVVFSTEVSESTRVGPVAEAPTDELDTVMPLWVKAGQVTPDASPGGLSASFLEHGQILECQAAKLSSLAFNPSGTLLAAGGTDGFIDVWDIENGRHLLSARAPAPVTALAFKPRARLLTSGDDSGRLCSWALPREPVGRKGITPGKVERLPAGIVDVSSNPEMMVVTLPGEVFRAEAGFSSTTRRGNVDIRMAVRAVFDPSGWLLAVGGALGDIMLIAPDDNWRVVQHLKDQPRPLCDLAFSPSGDRLAAASGIDDAVQIWDVSTGTLATVIQVDGAPVMCVAFAPDGTRVLVGRADGSVALWPLASSGEARLVGQHTHRVIRLAFVPHRARLASIGDDGLVRIWRIT